jgi:AraC-like DNA-binding protein
MQVAKERVFHPGQSLRFIRFELDAFRAPRHQHHHLELTWIERGSGLRWVGDDASPFNDGDLVLLGPDLPHTWLSSTRSDTPPGATRQRLVASVLQFEPALLAPAALPELAQAGAVMAAAGRGLRIVGQTASGITELMQRMHGADPHTQLAALVLIIGLWLRNPADLLPICSRPAGAASGPARRRVEAVLQWMQQHLRDDLRVADAAQLAHVSPAAFSRWFTREVGKPFTVHLNDLRHVAACLALRETERPVAWVAMDCGYLSASHFNEQFRRRAGCSPRDYRRLVRSGVEPGLVAQAQAQGHNPGIGVRT